MWEVEGISHAMGEGVQTVSASASRRSSQAGDMDQGHAATTGGTALDWKPQVVSTGLMHVHSSHSMAQGMPPVQPSRPERPGHLAMKPGILSHPDLWVPA